MGWSDCYPLMPDKSAGSWPVCGPEPSPPILTHRPLASILKVMERERLSWQEMKKRYPDQWLLIVDYETNNSDQMVSGVVEFHSTDMKQVAQAPAQSDRIAFRYTGESTFRGLRSHAHRHAL